MDSYYFVYTQEEEIRRAHEEQRKLAAEAEAKRRREEESMRKVQEEQKKIAQEAEARRKREEDEKKIRAAYEEARKMQEKVQYDEIVGVRTMQSRFKAYEERMEKIVCYSPVGSSQPASSNQQSSAPRSWNVLPAPQPVPIPKAPQTKQEIHSAKQPKKKGKVCCHFIFSTKYAKMTMLCLRRIARPQRQLASKIHLSSGLSSEWVN